MDRPRLVIARAPGQIARMRRGRSESSRHNSYGKQGTHRKAIHP